MLSEHHKNILDKAAGAPDGIWVRTERGKLKQGFRSHKTEQIFFLRCLKFNAACMVLRNLA
jgi:hypothetical protein